MNLIHIGVETALTLRYVDEVLTLTGTGSLTEALDLLKSEQKGETLNGQS
jgi:hypothetical protein